MKHIKTFESHPFLSTFKGPKYNVGDYVILKEDDVHKRWKVKLEGFIYKMFYNSVEQQYNYRVEGEYVHNNKETTFFISDSDIERKMTPEEIEDYQLRKESKKYNL